MKRSSLKSIYFLTIGILLLSLFFVFIKKEERKKQFSFLPEFSYTEIEGYKNSTKNLPQLDGYVVFLFNPGCEVCHKEAENISVNLDLFQNRCIVFLSPDSLNRIKSFVYKYHLHENENVFYGQINIDTIDAQLGKSTIPWAFIYNKNRKLIKSEFFLTVSEIDKYLSK